MRKVYHNERSFTGLMVALLLGVGVTAVLFGILPFSHIIAKPKAALEIRKASAVDVPPPVEQEAQPETPQEEKAEEKQAEPQLAAETAEAIPLSPSLDLATGTGGGLIGFGEVQRITAAEKVQDEVFSVSELEKRPEAVSQVAPTYPAELRKAKIEGVVTLVFLLGEDGRVEEARIENSSRPEFEKPALEAIRKWRFRPGEKDGQRVRTYVRQSMRFRAG
jgi:periplasmic protein TonB